MMSGWVLRYCMWLCSWLWLANITAAADCTPCGEGIPGYKRFSPLGPTCTHVIAGCKHDGIGAQMQARMSVWAYAQVTGKRYVHLPLEENMHVNNSKELATLERYFNLGQGEMSLQQAADSNAALCVAKHCYQKMDSRPSDWERLRAKLRRKLQVATAKPVFRGLPGKLTVALHVRRGDVTEKQDGPLERFSPESYFVYVLDQLRKGLPTEARDQLDVMVISQPVPNKTPQQQFPLLARFREVRFMLDQTTLEAMHSMISADVLVMSHSSFSFVAGLLSEGVVVYHEFWHARLPSWYEHPAHASRAARKLMQQRYEQH